MREGGRHSLWVNPVTGETHEVLKNFPQGAELAAVLRPFAREATLEETQYYWLLHFTLK